MFDLLRIDKGPIETLEYFYRSSRDDLDTSSTILALGSIQRKSHNNQTEYHNLPLAPGAIGESSLIFVCKTYFKISTFDRSS